MRGNIAGLGERFTTAEWSTNKGLQRSGRKGRFGNGSFLAPAR